MAALHDTLGFMGLHPARATVDISGTPISTTAKLVKAYFDAHYKKEMAKPDEQAVVFYALNQMLAIIDQKYDRAEPLSPKDKQIMDRYVHFIESEGIRAAMYLLVICIREARHMKSHTFDIFDANKVDKVKAEYGPAAWNWCIKHAGAENYTSLWEDTPNCTLGQLVSTIRCIFMNFSWSSSFGGKKWGEVTKCLESFVYGKTSMEMMLDTNWTLAHNGGPIFNKGMLYKGYNSGLLPYILDVQRGGMILNGILENHAVTSYATPAWLIDMTHLFAKRHPEPLFERPYIDWFAVKKLGAISDCKHLQEEQIEKHGASPHMTETDYATAEKVLLAKAMVEKEQALINAMFYNVDIKIKLKKTHREPEAV